jgi:hypothetical protein
MACVIQLLAPAHWTGIVSSTEDNRYLMDCDPATMSGEAWKIPRTADIKQAKQFDDAGDAIEFWRTQSRVNPIREGGKPNRPLTAFSVEIVQV